LSAAKAGEGGGGEEQKNLHTLGKNRCYHELNFFCTVATESVCSKKLVNEKNLSIRQSYPENHLWLYIGERQVRLTIKGPNVPTGEPGGRSAR